MVPTTHVYTSRAPTNAARFRIRLCRRLAPRCTKPKGKAHCLRAVGPITCLAPRPGWGVTELPTRLRSSASPPPAVATYVRGPVLSEALDGVGCMLALDGSRLAPCRATSELRSSSNCLCTTSSKRRSCIHVSRLGR